MNKILMGLLLLSAVSGTPGNSVSRALSPAEGDSIKTAAITPPAIGNAGGDSGTPKKQSEDFKAECALYGFEISEEWYPYEGYTFDKSTFTRKDGGYLQYQTDIQQVLLQNAKSPNLFGIVYRVVTSPVARRYPGVFGIGSHSDTWYTRKVRTWADLGPRLKLCQWAPTNEQKNFKGTMGISAASGGFSISASVDFNFSQLEVVSRTEMLTQHYETEYSVKWDNDYNLNSADYFGFFTFCRFSKTASPLITVSHQVDYYGSCWFGLESNTYSMPA